MTFILSYVDLWTEDKPTAGPLFRDGTEMCGIDLRTTLQTYRQQTRLLSKYFLIYYFI